MKIIEAMKQIKANKEKVAELIQRIQRNSAHLSIESPQYENQADKVKEWTQSCLDVSRDNVELLVRIARTNLATTVTIDLGGKPVTKTIAEWVWRRREYAGVDKAIWLSQGDRNLKEGMVQSSPGVMTDVKLVRYYDPAQRDANADIHMREPHQIDAALEVVNATTDLL
jgi:hypothetical protein